MAYNIKLNFYLLEKVQNQQVVSIPSRNESMYDVIIIWYKTTKHISTVKYFAQHKHTMNDRVTDLIWRETAPVVLNL